MIIDKVWSEWRSRDGMRVYSQEFFPYEYANHFPLDEPIADMFAIDWDRDGEATMTCPCGEVLDLPQLSREVRESAEDHVARKHSSWVPYE